MFVLIINKSIRFEGLTINHCVQFLNENIHILNAGDQVQIAQIIRTASVNVTISVSP